MLEWYIQLNLEYEDLGLGLASIHLMLDNMYPS